MSTDWGALGVSRGALELLELLEMDQGGGGGGHDEEVKAGRTWAGCGGGLGVSLPGCSPVAHVEAGVARMVPLCWAPCQEPDLGRAERELWL